MAITKVTGHVIDPITNITSHNINSSGIITATRFDGPIGAGLTDGNFSGIITATQLNVTGVGTFNGIGVTSLNVSGVSTFSGNIFGTGDVTITDTTADSAAGPEFKLYRNSASPADADYLGQIKFAGESDTGVERNYAKITGKILDASNGTEDGILEFAHIKAGSQTITGRWRSDSLQLLNGTSLTVAGTADVTGNMTVGGNLNVSGVLTYEDVTNIDSLGIVTARTGIKVLAGELTVGNNIKLGNAGVVTATSFIGDGSGLTGIAGTEHVRTASLTVSGVSTFTGMINSHVHIPDAVANNDYASIYLGTGNDVRFFHNGQNTFWQHKLGTPNNGGNLYIDSYSSLYLRSSDGSNNVRNAIILNGNDSVEIYHLGNKKLETTSTGAVVTGILTATSFSGSIAASGEIEASQDYPNQRPALDFNFAQEKVLDPRLMFARDGEGSYYDEFGLVRLAGRNEPRFDHDPVTRECKGLLMEEERTNLIPNSFDKGTWSTGSGGSTVTRNAGTAPDGTETATKVLSASNDIDVNPQVGPASAGATGQISISGGTTYTLSIWAKASTTAQVGNNFKVRWKRVQGDSTFAETTFALTADWTRYTATATTAANNSTVACYVGGVSGSEALVWGAQLEAGSFVTSLIPTSGGARTRYQDTMRMSGDDVTDVFNTTEGTMFYEASITDLTNDNQPIVTFNDQSNAAGNEIAMGYRTGGGSSGNIRTWMRSYVTGSQVNSFLSNHGSTGMVAGKPYKHIFGFKKDDAADSYNTGTNSAQTTDTSGNLPVAGSIDQLRFGSYYNNSTISQYPLESGHIKRFSYWPVRLTNSQLTTYIA